MALSVGTKLGPYEVVAAIGAGGMGEVYRAKDTRLGRDVAIKVLPQMLGKDADRLARFEQEARVLGALNHPNLLGIFDVGSENGLQYLVSEFLEGKTLREREAGIKAGRSRSTPNKH
jgi:serine/threonine protein kinase